MLLFIIFICGLLLIAYFSDLAVKHSAKLASALGVSSLVIGVTLVSIGTDLAEIVNSIIACSMGHGDINVGDSVGSSLVQITLVFGLLPIICGSFKVARKDFIIIGSCLILALILIYSIVEKGYITRLNAIFMISSLAVYLMVVYNVTKSDLLERVDLMDLSGNFKSKKYHASIAIIAFIGVAISSYFIILSIIALSTRLNIHEYLISFFILSIGTSLPELAVDVNALKRKEYDIAIGDILGSCIVDCTLSIAIGLILFPQKVSAELAIPTILYTIFVSIVVIIVVGVRGKMDKKSGILFICLYLGSFILFFALI